MGRIFLLAVLLEGCVTKEISQCAFECRMQDQVMESYDGNAKVCKCVAKPEKK